MLKSRQHTLASVMLLGILTVVPGGSVDPLSAGLAAGVGAAISAMWQSKDLVVCRYKECCNEPWIRKGVFDFEDKLDENLFGQHIAKHMIPKAVRNYLNHNNPAKPLVLSFHGWTGSGKNYAAKILAESLYEKGMESNYVHLFVAPIHFPHLSQETSYMDNVQRWIKGNVSACQTSLFIFDEIDKAPPGIIASIKPFVDHHAQLDGVSYRKSIFLFLSNTGGREITEVMLDHYLNGDKRNDLKYEAIEQRIHKGVFNEEGGLYKAPLIEKGLIDAYIPFLPLERVHVKQCIKKEVEVQNKTITPDEVDMLADRMAYWPKNKLDDSTMASEEVSHELTNLFSTTGCKRVASIVNLYL